MSVGIHRAHLQILWYWLQKQGLPFHILSIRTTRQLTTKINPFSVRLEHIHTQISETNNTLVLLTAIITPLSHPINTYYPWTHYQNQPYLQPIIAYAHIYIRAYISNCTRPKINPFVSFLSVYNHHPSLDHSKSAIYDLYYVHSMSDLGIHFSSALEPEPHYHIYHPFNHYK